MRKGGKEERRKERKNEIKKDGKNELKKKEKRKSNSMISSMALLNPAC